MIFQRLFNHAVDGFRVRGSYPRSNYEAGLGLSLGGLIALLFGNNAPLFWGGLVFAFAWTAFYLWAFWRAVQLMSRDGDRDYDKRGKFALSKEYWKTESHTSAKARKKKHG